jgi:hypothetical protein
VRQRLPLAADRIDEARNAGRREGAEEAGRGWEAVEVAGDDQLGVGGDGGREHMSVLGVVGHRGLEPSMITTLRWRPFPNPCSRSPLVYRRGVTSLTK